MNKDVLLTIYEILHRDLTKQLNAEYLQKLRRCRVNNTYCNICKCCITIKYDHDLYPKTYNYRSSHYKAVHVYTKYKKVRCYISANY